MTPDNKKEEIILGIDPGTNRIGYGLIRVSGQKQEYIASGLIEIKEKYTPQQLKTIHDRINEVIDIYNPNKAAVEKLFFSNNKKTAISVSEARGAILLTLALRSIKTTELLPNEVKRTVTGYGQADKAAILKMVGLLLKLKDFKPIDDTSDALAIAIASSMVS
ncbi:MAG: crossover junction endodeoxyribonuclease RuvC [Candidatus Colwellbacteria bacterium]|nr:crossover junction endodeoxyribonuclease RuvC [Candidatus Colwellbacteria bacterium]